jgi:endonuclease/exonuclease/phosphatase family metal-dependent hydrolase
MKRHYIAFIIITLFMSAGCSHVSKKGSVSVMTLNLRYDNPHDSLNAWPNRVSQVCKFINSEKPSIIGMQEVLWHQFADLDSLLTDYSSEGKGRDDGARGGEMNPVFFRKDRFDMIRTITFWLSDTPDIPGSMAWGASLPRIVTWMELADKDSHQHLFIFNTHFAHDSDSARIISSRLLLKEVGRIAEGFPFIITGDFNMGPLSAGYAILTGPDESVPLMKDSYIISEKKPYGPSYTFNGFSDKQGDERIDFIFVRNGMQVLSHSTFIRKDHGVFISDHWPVEAVISLDQSFSDK